MKEVLSKLAAARTYIKSHPIRKDASNTFSKYDYFSPELVASLVNKACIESDSICVFNLKQDQHGYYGEVIFTDLESGESITTIMRTEKPEIKATNATQQMGGMNTYAKRYALMSLFDIEDNTIDFDAQDNTKQPEKKQAAPAQTDDKPWLNKGSKEYEATVKKLQAGSATLQTVKQYFKLSKDVQANLEACTKDLIPEAPLHA